MLSDTFDFSAFGAMDEKAVVNFLDMPAIIDYIKRYDKQSAAREYYIGFLSAAPEGGRERKPNLRYLRVTVSEMLRLSMLSHTSEGMPVFRLNFNAAQRRYLERFSSVLAYDAKAAFAEIGQKNAGFAFEELLARKFANTLTRAPRGISSKHGDDFFIDIPNSARVWFGCKFAEKARVELTDASETAFTNLYGENPWYTIYEYKGIKA